MCQHLKGTTLFTINVVCLYPNISHQEGLASLRRFLNKRTEKKVTTETSVQLAEIVLKSNIFQFNQETLKQFNNFKEVRRLALILPHRMQF